MTSTEPPPERPQQVWSVGLQPERTSLAWQRLNLAGLAATIVSARLLVESHPWLGYTLAVLGAVTAGLLTVVHSSRLRRTNRSLFDGRALPDGREHLLALVLLVLVAVTALAFTLTTIPGAP